MEITTKRLVLRPWAESDAERLYELAKDPEVGPAAGWFPHTDAEDSRRVIREILSVPGTYAVVLKKSGEVIGSCGMFGTAAAGAEGEPEIGYWIGRDYWGHEYAPEAVRALLGLCFAGGNERVWCAYFEGNEKSRRCMEKCGFCYHHTEEDVPWRPTGETKTEHYTCITREEWKKRRKAE